ncbi:MAG TPA: YggS family pyridoxal phosphate-dependent enzyme [Pseudomonas sp.]|nr:YggS family pyridoxal phosphate-dependent enzyme [Pseudomonas sp.]
MNDSSAYPQAETIEQLRQNLATVRARIDQACVQAGRDPQEVRLLPVSKTHPADYLRLAYAAGCRRLGENKVQEAYQKWQELEDLKDLEWSVIGHLQTNKAKYVARFASEFHALDSLRLAQALDQRLIIEDRYLDVLVQINTSGEESKYGIDPEQAPELITQLGQFSRLRVRGLMTLAMNSENDQAVRGCFIQLRELRDSLQAIAPQGMQLTELSMGMSGDFELAIAEGATIVRIGQAIFGARAQPDSYYWPQ